VSSFRGAGRGDGGFDFRGGGLGTLLTCVVVRGGGPGAATAGAVSLEEIGSGNGFLMGGSGSDFNGGGVSPILIISSISLDKLFSETRRCAFFSSIFGRGRLGGGEEAMAPEAFSLPALRSLRS